MYRQVPQHGGYKQTRHGQKRMWGCPLATTDNRSGYEIRQWRSLETTTITIGAEIRRICFDIREKEQKNLERKEKGISFSKGLDKASTRETIGANRTSRSKVSVLLSDRRENRLKSAGKSAENRR